VWRRWYVIGPAAVVLGVAAAIVVGLAVHDQPDGQTRTIGK
jgi:hypothetical protein